MLEKAETTSVALDSRSRHKRLIIQYLVTSHHSETHLMILTQSHFPLVHTDIEQLCSQSLRRGQIPHTQSRVTAFDHIEGRRRVGEG